MAWTSSIAGKPSFLQLFDDPDALCPEHPTRSENILALARLAANKAFADAGTWEEERWGYREDAIQEAATVILEHAPLGPRIAYWRARKRLVTWIITVIYQGKPRRKPGERTIPTIACSLDAFDYEPQWLHRDNPVASPDAALTAEKDWREACIEAMYEVVYDIVVSQMKLERRHRYTAHKDAEIFQYTLRGYETAAIMRELGIAERTANQRVQFARERLERLLTEQGLDQIAAHYRGEGRMPLNRAARAFVEEVVDEQRTRHLQKHGSPPAKRTLHTWTANAYAEWRRSA